MDSVWKNLQIKFSQGFIWLTYFSKDNPIYAALGCIFLIFLLWMFLKPEIDST
jgi:hypothetical protein